MRKSLVLAFFFVQILSAAAQEKKSSTFLNLFAGRAFSTFTFKDSEGVRDKNINYIPGNACGISLGFALGKGHLIRPEINYYELGARKEIQSVKTAWKLNYLGVSAGYLFAVIQKKAFSLSPGFSLGGDYLLKGTQTTGDVKYNLKTERILKNWDVNAGLICNAQYRVTDAFFLNFEYRFHTGLNQIEREDKGEHTRNMAHRALLGLSFKL
jgi:hypothetical protein